MNEQEYNKLIPHACTRTPKQHMEMMLCWSITNGYVEQALGRGSEGPQFCHECDLSVRAKRWDEFWYKKMFGTNI